MTDRLSPVWRDPSVLARLNGRGWEELLGQARRARLLARLALRLRQQPGGWDSVPPAPRHHLRGSLHLLERQRQEVLFELSQMRRVLQPLGVPLVLLKGAAYLRAGLPPSQGRMFSDIDLLVPRHAIAQAESALMAGGWISEERDAYNQRYYREWMHEVPPLAHVHRGSCIDLHHTITPPTSRFRVDGRALLQRIQPIGDTGFHMLAPEDMVLHSATHLYQEGEFDHGLRDLLDLHDLLRHFGADDAFWPRLVARAAEMSLGEPLCMLLAQRQRLLGELPPPACADALARLQPAWPRRVGVGWCLRHALQPPHPAVDGPATRVARSLLYVRSHAMRMPLRLLLPHLVRKAFMARFPARSGDAAA